MSPLPHPAVLPPWPPLAGLTASRSPQVLDLLALNPAAGGATPGSDTSMTTKEVHSLADIEWVLRQASEATPPLNGPMHTRLLLSLSGGARQFARLLFVELAGTGGGPPEADRCLSLSHNALASVLLHLGAGAPRPPWEAAPLTAWLRPALAEPPPAVVLVLATVAPPGGLGAALGTLGWAARLRMPGQGGGVTLSQAGIDWAAFRQAAPAGWVAPEELADLTLGGEEDGEEDAGDTAGEAETAALRSALAAAEEGRVAESRARRSAEAAAREARAEAEELWLRAQGEAAEAREEASRLRAQLRDAQEERDGVQAQVRGGAPCLSMPLSLSSSFPVFVLLFSLSSMVIIIIIVSLQPLLFRICLMSLLRGLYIFCVLNCSVTK